MLKPQSLRTGEYYSPALLWLMGRLKSAAVETVFVEFEREFSNCIPAEHRDTIKRNLAKWKHHVHWARQYLVNAGLMGSGGRGIWTITPEGQQWLTEHPEDDGQAVLDLIRSLKKQGIPGAAKQPATSAQPKQTRRSSAPTGLGFSYDDLKHIRQYLPPDEFQARFGERWEALLAEERSRSQTIVSDQELGRRARQVLREVHAFLNGTSGAVPSEKACDWLQFCYALGLYRETAVLFNYIIQDDLPAWAYERACKVAEACRARMG